jgi:hypothetical protein
MSMLFVVLCTETEDECLLLTEGILFPLARELRLEGPSPASLLTEADSRRRTSAPSLSWMLVGSAALDHRGLAGGVGIPAEGSV